LSTARSPGNGLRLLLVNPNTSVHITERLAASARAALLPGERLTALTAQAGPTVVRSAEGLREAQVSALAMVDQHAADHDGVLLGISLDGAAVALRERHPGLPVVGMTEAALMSACLRVERVGLLTLGGALLPLYRERVAQIGLAQRVVAFEAPEAPTAFAAGTALVEPAVLDVLAASCDRLRDAGAPVGARVNAQAGAQAGAPAGAQAIVLAGAVLCGYAAALSARCGMPVFDGVACAVGQLRILCQMRSAEQHPPDGAATREPPHAAT